jgi:ATP-binding cassette subfamily E protein 1
MRIAVLDLDKCQPKKCNFICIKFCPGVRMGEETIIVDEETKKPIISEVLCSGCGICIHKCPFDAIAIVNLPQELEEPIHQFGPNTFRLYRLPIPREKQILGLIGANGVGKTTAIRILSGEINPNLGEYKSKEAQDVSTYFRGSELQSYFEKLQSGSLKVVMKPQQITKIPTVVKGHVSEVIKKTDERGMSETLITSLDMKAALNKDIKTLSGGELQRLALIVAMCREADVYYLDEPSSYLDINQRLNVSKAIRSLSEEKSVIVVEHDLALLDYLSDYVHILYGQPGVYGICSVPYGVRVGINSYWDTLC